ncbi:MAG: hypothetical protein ABW352_19770 [Polyangiales bacterium]
MMRWWWLMMLVACTPPMAQVVNASRVSQCAEEDNVYVKLVGKDLRKLRVEARHPSYMKDVQQDLYEPDFTSCNFDGNAHPTDPVFRFEPKRVILWETEQYLMVGNTYETFWRNNTPDFVVNGVVTPQIHLMQLYLKDKDEPKLGRHQFLVLYPPDGYWRAKPIPTLPLNYGVYGTSFLVGPVEEQVRPIVDLTRVEFDPKTLTFALTYRDGAHGTLQVAQVDREKIALEYTHDRALPSDRPLAAVRSMYVTPERADLAELSWRQQPKAPLTVTSLPSVTTLQTLEVNFGRSVIANHNRSAPDMWFGAFRR